MKSCFKFKHYQLIKISLLLSYALISLVFVSQVYAQESYYISSKLQLGMHTKASLDSPVLALISSGTSVEIIETGQDFSRIKTPEGAEGWVKTQFLTQDEPAILQVAKLEKSLEALSQNAASSEASSQTSTMDTVTESLSSSEKENYEDTIADLKEELRAWEQLDAQDREAKKIQAEKLNQQLQERLSMIASLAMGNELADDKFSFDSLIKLPKIKNDDSEHSIIKFFKKNYIILLMISGLSFFLGIFVMDMFNRRRHGGFRV